MPQLGILPKLIFRGNFASFDFLSQSLISFAQEESRGLVSSLKNQLLLMPMLNPIAKNLKPPTARPQKKAF
jgi:hypothetical protein